MLCGEDGGGLLSRGKSGWSSGHLPLSRPSFSSVGLSFSCNRKKVKSLVGLLNTFSKYIPNVSQLTVKMRELTEDRCAFLWTEEHEEEMEAINSAAANSLPLRPFCIQFASQIYTDASHLGIGVAFTQVDPAAHEYFVQCGSSACTPAMRNYGC